LKSISRKENKEHKASIEQKQEGSLYGINEKIEERNAHLKAKKGELDAILKRDT